MTTPNDSAAQRALPELIEAAEMLETAARRDRDVGNDMHADDEEALAKKLRALEVRTALAAAPKDAAAPEGEMVSLQSITDPENQPSQYGTVTLDYHYDDAPPGWKSTPNGWERTGADIGIPTSDFDKGRETGLCEAAAIIMKEEGATDTRKKILSFAELVRWSQPGTPAQTGAALEAQERDAARWRAVRARHSYALVRRFTEEDGYNSQKASGLLDAWADQAIGDMEEAGKSLAALSAGGRGGKAIAAPGAGKETP